MEKGTDSKLYSDLGHIFWLKNQSKNRTINEVRFLYNKSITCEKNYFYAIDII